MNKSHNADWVKGDHFIQCRSGTANTNKISSHKLGVVSDRIGQQSVVKDRVIKLSMAQLRVPQVGPTQTGVPQVAVTKINGNGTSSESNLPCFPFARFSKKLRAAVSMDDSGAHTDESSGHTDIAPWRVGEFC